MKGNNQLFSSRKADRIKGYKKLFKKQGDYYKPPRDYAKDIVEAMTALGHEVTLQEVEDYMRSSYAAGDRRFYLETRRK
jgi:hypothetical protein